MSVTRPELPADEAERARLLGAPLIVLPSNRASDGRGVYGEATLTLVKELRAAGLQAQYADPSDRRLFEVKKGVLLDAVLNISFGLTGTAIWEGTAALLRHRHAPEQQLELTVTELAPDGTTTTYRASGRADEVIASIDEARHRPPLPPGS